MATKSKIGGGADTTTQDVADQMATLRADIGALTSLVTELAQNKGADLSDAAKEQVSAVKQSARDHAEAAKDQAQQLQDQATAFARDQPAVALGVAAGLGFLVGMLMTRK